MAQRFTFTAGKKKERFLDHSLLHFNWCVCTRTETETEIRDRQSVRQTRREAETGPRLYMAEQYEKNELTRKTLVASVEKN